jgi:hypothetical protein
MKVSSFTLAWRTAASVQLQGVKQGDVVQVTSISLSD